MSTAQRALIVSTASFAALTVLAATDWVAGTDRRLTTWIFGWPESWHGAMRTTWRLATRRVALLWIGLALLVWRKLQPAVAMVAAALTSWGLALLTKELVGRSRPSAALLGAPPRDPLAGHGYPSAHAALAAALIVPVLFVVPAGLAASVARCGGAGRGQPRLQRRPVRARLARRSRARRDVRVGSSGRVLEGQP